MRQELGGRKTDLEKRPGLQRSTTTRRRKAENLENPDADTCQSSKLRSFLDFVTSPSGVPSVHKYYSTTPRVFFLNPLLSCCPDLDQTADLTSLQDR